MQVKKSLDLSTILGLGLGFGSLTAAIVLEFNELNPDLGSIFLQLSAVLIIFGGTIGATMLSFTLEDILKIPQLLILAVTKREFDPQGFVDRMYKFAEAARREGILQLEREIPALEQEDWFLALGLRMIVDGSEPQIVEEMLNNEVQTMSERHKAGIDMFGSMGGYAPTMGIVGTVVGLISALAKAGGEESDPTAIVSAIATAFIATFYGIGFANLFFLPIQAKLKLKSEQEVFMKSVQVEALKAIQSGENPRIVYDKLAVLFKRGTIPPLK